MSDLLPHEELLQISEHLEALAAEGQILYKEDITEIDDSEQIILDEFQKKGEHQFEEAKRNMLSIIDIVLERGEYARIKMTEIHNLSTAREEVLFSITRSGMEQRLGEVFDVLGVIEALKKLSIIAKEVGMHLQRKQNVERQIRVGNSHSDKFKENKIFIGHGGSKQWYELRNFIENKLDLPTDEFNRVQAAGTTVSERLHQMLNDAALAFLVMTGEDKDGSGGVRARENVVHEVGLFQGRLGMSKAIILLEEGCQIFSNIHGVQTLNFPKGKIRSVFQDIREVCEREGLIAERSS